MLRFAQLLVEIETGERTPFKHESPSDEDVMCGIEDVIKLRRNEFARGDYNDAVQNFLKFKALLNAELAHGKEKYLLSQARSVLYTNIIEPLEKKFNLVPDPASARTPRPLKIQGYTTSHVPIISTSQVTSENTLTAMSNYTKRHEETRRLATPFHCHSTLEPEHSNIGVLFFDGEFTPRKEYVVLPLSRIR